MWLTAKDIQKRTSMNKNKVYALFHTKSFPSFKIGKMYYVTDTDYEKWERRISGKEIKIEAY